MQIKFKKVTLKPAINKSKNNSILSKLSRINILVNRIFDIFYLKVNCYKVNNIIFLGKLEV